ncbi:hypothetical protein CSUI_009313 [Cystoisospora suis]|uniref:Uncharacterized protein n=1 Tax=Cystoisospora suis TaxID=483139 RepID=A0A2C6KK63_9APIC|nr:hypothetical protein CSUI_009313 [Cystoisospora suis]
MRRFRTRLECRDAVPFDHASSDSLRVPESLQADRTCVRVIRRAVASLPFASVLRTALRGKPVIHQATERGVAT